MNKQIQSVLLISLGTCFCVDKSDQSRQSSVEMIKLSRVQGPSRKVCGAWLQTGGAACNFGPDDLKSVWALFQCAKYIVGPCIWIPPPD